jgi:iron complex transport system substrate-binding protein
MPTRIASLLPDATEILCALGRGKLIVGVSHECAFPPEIVGRPVLTEPRDSPESAEAGADDATAPLVRSGLSVYAVKGDALRNARPELIVTRDRSAACAASQADLQRAVSDWLGYAVGIVSIDPRRVDDVPTSIQQVAHAVRADFQGQELLEGMRKQLEFIRERATHARGHPRVVCIQGIEPLTVAGNWIPELVELCGGTYGLVPPGEPDRSIDWGDLVAYQPEVVILMPRGLTLARTRQQRQRLTERPEWAQLPAVPNRRVYSADGTAYLHRAGPRIADGATLLAGLIQPSLFASRIPVGSYELVR